MFWGGEAVDDAGGENNNPNYTQHRALVQMHDEKEATWAMHSLDFSWQMGRLLKVEYAHWREIRWHNSAIALARQQKAYFLQQQAQDEARVRTMVGEMRAQRRAEREQWRQQQQQAMAETGTDNNGTSDEEETQEEVGTANNSSSGNESSAEPMTTTSSTLIETLPSVATTISSSCKGASGEEEKEEEGHGSPKDGVEEEEGVEGDDDADQSDNFSSCTEGVFHGQAGDNNEEENW